jgi:hypothetical protein
MSFQVVTKRKGETLVTKILVKVDLEQLGP